METFDDVFENVEDVETEKGTELKDGSYSATADIVPEPTITLGEAMAQAEPIMEKHEQLLFSSHAPYPFINTDGEMKLGLAITLKEDADDSIFNDTEVQEMMITVDSESGLIIKNEQPFNLESLNKKNKAIPAEVFENLSNVKKAVTLSKTFKNLANKGYIDYHEINISPEEKVMVEKAITKTAATSSSMQEKIKENVSDDLEGMLTSYAFRKHLLITGDAGQGKTYIVDKHIKDKGYVCVQENGHTGLEAIDLVGYVMKKDDGTFVWKDGSLSEAFRKAQTQKVVYFMDEILRIPARELNILVASLTPNSSGELKLKTMRIVGEIDGIGNSETITVPQENFWVVSTTNQGSGYQSSRIDEALKDRFRLYYQEMSASDVHAIVEHKYKRLGGSSIAVKAIVSLIEKTGDIQASGNIPRAFTIRHLSEAIDTADNLQQVKKRLIELVPNIVSIDSDGKFNKEQMEIVKSIIKKTI